MKKVLMWCFLACLLPSVVFADDKTINVEASLLGAISIEYKVSDRFTVGLDYTEINPGFDMTSNYYSTGSVGARAYIYPKGAMQSGPYATMFVDYASFDYDDSSWWGNTTGSKQGSGSSPMIGFLAGYHWVLWDYLTFSVAGGYGYMMPVDITVTDSVTAAATNVKVGNKGFFDLDLNVGMSF